MLRDHQHYGCGKTEKRHVHENMQIDILQHSVQVYKDKCRDAFKRILNNK